MLLAPVNTRYKPSNAVLFVSVYISTTVVNLKQFVSVCVSATAVNFKHWLLSLSKGAATSIVSTSRSPQVSIVFLIPENGTIYLSVCPSTDENVCYFRLSPTVFFDRTWLTSYTK